LLQFAGGDLAVDGRRVLAQHGMAGLHDRRQRFGRQDFLDGFLDLRRAKGRGRGCCGHGESLAAADRRLLPASASLDAMAELIASEPPPLDRVLDFVRTLEAGGRGEDIRPFLSADFVLVQAPHLLAPEGSIRTLDQVLDGADQSARVVADQKFGIRRTTCEAGRVVVEADWSATALMDLRYWDAGETIRARTSSVFEVRDGRIVSQDSYDCYFPGA
jgi:ketosteroid isomerase-like protein